MADKQESCGAFWLKESAKGTKYMSGNFKVPDNARPGDTLDLVVFKNDKGDNPKRPDYRVYLSEKREETRPAQISPSVDFQDDVPF